MSLAAAQVFWTALFLLLPGDAAPGNQGGVPPRVVDAGAPQRLELRLESSLPSEFLTPNVGSNVRGGVLVWAGGAALAGTLPGVIVKDSSLSGSGNFCKSAGHAVRTVDLTGDGLPDLLVVGEGVSPSFVPQDTGALLLAPGPIGASPSTLFLSVPDAQAGDMLAD